MVFHSAPASLLRVLLGFLAAIGGDGLNVALFPSTGCYSHDVMMKQVGQEFPSSDNVTWIQAYLYEFGFGQMTLPADWSRISILGVDEEGTQLMNQAGHLLWQQNVPTDFDRPWDLRGSFHFIKILERHQSYCEQTLLDERFRRYVGTGRADVVVLDHFLQECMGGLTHLLNASVIQFSNWPIADGYIASLNVPANPSSTPKTGTPFSGLGMTFLERVCNVLFHTMIVVARMLQTFILDRLFARHGYPEVRIIQTEADRVIHAGRSEFLFDVVRPINNRVKHFGGANIEPKDYVIDLPPEQPAGLGGGNMKMYLDTTIAVSNGTIVRTLKECEQCSHPCQGNRTAALSHIQYRSEIYRGVSTHEVEGRLNTVQTKFPGIDWHRISRRSFILVSFGSVAKVENMPISLLRKLLGTFGRSRHDILWQTNSAMEGILLANNITLPENTRITSWAPIKELLAHPNLQYIVCHGGINTMNELLLFGVPVVGVPLQGDQGSNLRRLADLGAAEVVSTSRLKEGDLEKAMSRMEANLNSYWRRASRLSSMVRQYRSLHRNDQKFWLNWTARNGRKMRGRNIMRMSYIGDEENLFWLSIGALLATVFVQLL